MLERKEKLQINQMDSLSKKIQANRAKVNQNRGVPGLEAEVERLDNAIASVCYIFIGKRIGHLHEMI